MRLDPADLRAFAARPWAAVERAKREFIAEQYREEPAAHVASIHALRDHLRLVRPEWPTPDDLAADLADHVALTRKLDRVADFLRDR